MSEQCKQTVYTGAWFHSTQCSRKAKKDGYCTQHHPDTVKARQDKRDAKWEAERAASPYARLAVANAKIAELKRALRILSCDSSWMREGICDPNSGNFRGQMIAQEALEGDK